MKHLYVILIGGMLLGAVTGWGQKRDPKVEAIERHYQYLEGETQAFREAIEKENDDFRTFIQQERAEHQQFLQTTYAIAGIIIAVVIGLLSFFGWNTFQGINKSRREIESVATSQLLEYSKSLNETQNRLYNAQQSLLDLEKKYQDYIGYYRNADPKNGRYLFIGSKEKLEQMTQDELIRFVQVFDSTEKLESDEILRGNFYPTSYDVIIYRSNVDKEGQDGILERIADIMRPFKNIPLVVYAANRDEWLKGNTEKKFSEHKLVHLANNQVSLIDNVASAYRVSKMLPK